MEFIKENHAVIMLAILVVIVVFCVWLVLLCNRIYKNFYVKKFAFVGMLERKDEEEFVTLVVSNRSLNDITVNAIGLCNGAIYYDFMGEYRKKGNIPDNVKVVIPSRNSLRLRLEKSAVEEQVTGGMTALPKSVCAYIVDSFGGLAKGKIRAVGKQIKKDYASFIKQRKAEEKQLLSQKKKAEKENLLQELSVKRLMGDDLTLSERLKLWRK